MVTVLAFALGLALGVVGVFVWFAIDAAGSRRGRARRAGQW